MEVIYMADKKTTCMAEFYQLCQKKGYTNMHDETQSLKAKVIATDLGLNYGNIVTFYEKAKGCDAQVQEEKRIAEQERAEQAKRKAEEIARTAVDGELLITLYDRKDPSENAKTLRVYIRPDQSIYTTIDDGPKIEKAPSIKVQKAGATYFQYHPSKAIYTGATVGGITTGGVHYTKAGYSTTQDNQGKGEIVVQINSTSFVLKLVTFARHASNLFKRDDQFHKLVNKYQILCYQESYESDRYFSAVGALANQGDPTMALNVASAALDKQRLPIGRCKEIAELLGRVVYGEFPPSDEQLYEMADNWAKEENADSLGRAIDTFNRIKGYKDAQARAVALKPKFQELLQLKKERAVLEKEQAKKTRRITLIATAIVAVIAIVVGICLLLKQEQKEKAYAQQQTQLYDIQSLAQNLFSYYSANKKDSIKEEIAEIINTPWKEEEFIKQGVKTIQNETIEANGFAAYDCFQIKQQQILLEEINYKCPQFQQAYKEWLIKLFNSQAEYNGLAKIADYALNGTTGDEEIYNQQLTYYSDPKNVFLKDFLPTFIEKEWSSTQNAADTEAVLNLCGGLAVVSAHADLNTYVDVNSLLNYLKTDAQQITIQQDQGHYANKGTSTNGYLQSSDTTSYYGDLASTSTETLLKGERISWESISKAFVKYAYEDGMVSYYKDGFCYAISDTAIVCFVGAEFYFPFAGN